MRYALLRSPGGSRAAAFLGILLIALGVAIALASVAMAASSGNAGWLVLMLPAAGLMDMGTTIYRARYDLAARPRRIRTARPRRSPVQDFAHHNKAWDNVARWESKLEHRERFERSIGKPRRKLESWAFRLRR